MLKGGISIIMANYQIKASFEIFNRRAIILGYPVQLFDDIL